MAKKLLIFLLLTLKSNIVTSFDRPYIPIGAKCQYSEQCVLGDVIEKELQHIPHSERDIKFGACNISTQTCCDFFGDDSINCIPKLVIDSNCEVDIECRHIPGICGEVGVCTCDPETSVPAREGIRSFCTCNPGLERTSIIEDCDEFSWKVELGVIKLHCSNNDTECLVHKATIMLRNWR